MSGGGGRLLEFTFHLLLAEGTVPERGRDSCLDPLKDVKRVEGEGGGIYFMKGDPGCRQGAFEERGEISRISISITSGVISPSIYKSPRPSQINIFSLSTASFSFDNTGNRIVRR